MNQRILRRLERSTCGSPDCLRIVQRFIEERANSRKVGIMHRLRQIRIEAPEDFSTNLDSYVNGEKQLPEQGSASGYLR
jgi:hypothetical protein